MALTTVLRTNVLHCDSVPGLSAESPHTLSHRHRQAYGCDVNRRMVGRSAVELQWNGIEVEWLLHVTVALSGPFFRTLLHVSAGRSSTQRPPKKNPRALLMWDFDRPDAVPSPNQQRQSTEAVPAATRF